MTTCTIMTIDGRPQIVKSVEVEEDGELTFIDVLLTKDELREVLNGYYKDLYGTEQDSTPTFMQELE